MLLKRTTSNDSDFQKLVLLLDQFLQSKDDEDHDFYAQHNKTDHIKHVVVAYYEDEAIGCGAFKAFDEKSVEIKRMFVVASFRGKQVAINTKPPEACPAGKHLPAGTPAGKAASSCT
jgi:hypothetical protein